MRRDTYNIRLRAEQARGNFEPPEATNRNECRAARRLLGSRLARLRTFTRDLLAVHWSRWGEA
jgi:hypothetical protein